MLLDGAEEMLEQARERLPASAITTVVADMRERLPEGPFDAVVSALAIHHLEDDDKRKLLARVHGVLRPGGAFVNAEHVTGPSGGWRACTGGCGARRAARPAPARTRSRRLRRGCRPIAVSRSPPSSGGCGAAGLRDCDCFFKHLHFAVLAGWRA